MGPVRLVHSTVAVSLVVGLFLAGLSHAQTVAEGPRPSGRWEFTTATPPPAAAGSRGRGTTGAGPATRTVTLNLKVGPAGTLVGTVAIPGSGRAGGTGGNPSRPVEISDAKVEGAQVSFTAWQFDGYKNRIRYDGVVEGDRLSLTMTRETANGAERTQAVAVRKPY